MDVSELLEEWSAKYDVKSVLERIGVGAAPLCTTLARRGAEVSAIVDDERGAQAARAAFGSAVRLQSGRDEGDKHDLVVLHGHLDPAEIAPLGKRATKLIFVVAPNPRALQARLSGESAREQWGATALLAATLWELGRVREHQWTDAPAFVARVPRLQRALSRRHVFVVDVTPRSPQARRKVRLQAAT